MHKQCFPEFGTDGNERKSNSDQERAICAVERCIVGGHNVLVILRGVPGSGKSFLARRLQNKGRICSADNFFYDSRGQYSWDATRLNEAHKYCKNAASAAIRKKVTPILIDNTNIGLNHMRPYVHMASTAGYEVYFLEPSTDWRYNEHECFKRNAHSLAKDKIEQLLDTFSRNFTLQSILGKTISVVYANAHASSTPTTCVSLSTNTPVLAATRRMEQLTVSGAAENCLAHSASAPAINLRNVPAADQPSTSSLSVKKKKKRNRDQNKQTSAAGGTSGGGKRGELSDFLLSNKSNSWKLTDSLLDGLLTELSDDPPPSSSVSPDVDDVQQYQVPSFSLLPLATDVRVDLCDVGSQVEWLDLTLAALNITPRRVQLLQGETAPMDSYRETRRRREPPLSAKSRPTQTDSNPGLSPLHELTSSDFAKIQRIFDNADVHVLRHVLESCADLAAAVRLLLELDFPLRRHSDAALDAVPEQCVVFSETFPAQPTLCVVEEKGKEVVEEEDDVMDEDEEESSMDGSAVYLDLDPDFADQLQGIFGAVGTDDLPAELFNPRDLRVKLPLSLAREIHEHWKETLVAARSSLLDETADSSTDSGLVVGVTPSSSRGLASSSHYATDLAEARRQQEIDDAEYARHLHEQQLKGAGSSSLPAPVGNEEHLATVIKRRMLADEFPSIDAATVKVFFEANDCELNATRKELIALYGYPSKSTSTLDFQNYPAIKVASEARDEEDKCLVGPLNYHDLRQESLLLRQQRDSCFEKAGQHYHSQSQRAAAFYYANEGRVYDKKMRQANQRASEAIIAERERIGKWNELDLHGLHVSEAETALRRKLARLNRNEPYRNGPGVRLKVITGKGTHSQGERPKIKPAVVSFLTQAKYTFTQEDEGVCNCNLPITFVVVFIIISLCF